MVSRETLWASIPPASRIAKRPQDAVLQPRLLGDETPYLMQRLFLAPSLAMTSVRAPVSCATLGARMLFGPDDRCRDCITITIKSRRENGRSNV